MQEEKRGLGVRGSLDLSVMWLRVYVLGFRVDLLGFWVYGSSFRV